MYRLLKGAQTLPLTSILTETIVPVLRQQAYILKLVPSLTGARPLES